AYNGVGTSPGEYTPDTLTPAVTANQAQFNMINHTYTHLNLDSATYAQVTQELQQNDQVAQQMGFTNYWKNTFVQPDISGLNAPNALQALHDFGVQYIISDTSQAGWNNPSPNAGFYST